MNLFESIKVNAKNSKIYSDFIDLHRVKLRELSKLYYDNLLDKKLIDIIESDIDPIEGFNNIFEIFYSETSFTLYYLSKYINENFENHKEFFDKLSLILNNKNIENNKINQKKEENIDIDIIKEKDIFYFKIEENNNIKVLVIYKDNKIVDSFDDYITILGNNIDTNLKSILKSVQVDDIYYKIGKMGKDSKGFTYNENPELYRNVVNEFIKEYLYENK